MAVNQSPRSSGEGPTAATPPPDVAAGPFVTGDGQAHDRIEKHSPSNNLKPLDDVTITQKMLSAVSGSVLTSLLVTPLDVVRVRLQAQQSSAPTESSAARPRSFANLPANLGVTACCREVFWVNNNAPYCVAGSSVIASSEGGMVGAECAAEEVQRKTYHGTLDGMRKIARNEGFFTLWRGLSPTLVMAVPGNVIYFAGYDWLRTSKLSPLRNRVPDPYAPLVAGSTARVIAAFFVGPIELFRTRMQASTSSSPTGIFKDTLSGVREMVHHQGYHTLWRGLTLTLWRDVPFSALYWWGYETGRNVLTDMREKMRGRETDLKSSLVRRRSDSRSQQNHSSTFVDSFVAGAVSGGISSVVTTPFDVGKTRQQVYQQVGDSAGQTAKNAAGELTAENSSMLRLLWTIFREEGTSGLFRGWAPRCLKVAPACAIMISSYEIGKKMAQGLGREE